MFTLFWLVFISGGIWWLVKGMKRHKREQSASIKGAFICGEVSDGRTSKTYDYLMTASNTHMSN